MFEGSKKIVVNIVMILVGLILIGIVVPNIDNLINAFDSSSNEYYGQQIFLLIPLFLGVGLLAYASFDTVRTIRGSGGAKSRRR